MCGEKVDYNLYNWKTDSMKDISCDLPSYKNLITLCFKGADTVSVAGFIRSICIYDFVKPTTHPKRETATNRLESLAITPPDTLWRI